MAVALAETMAESGHYDIDGTTVRTQSNRTKTICYSKRLYRQRNGIERVLGHPKINRAVATRYDQLAIVSLE